MRFHLDFCPRASWQTGVDAEDQRWTRTPNLFTGSEDEATIECSDLEAAYDRAVIFRAVPLPETDSDERDYCAGCGGDYRDAPGAEFACSCAIRPVRWTRPVAAEEKAS